jgi:CheY-like chemotaxis protein
MARENILVVDDEPDMRDALTAALRREGLCLSTAANGVEALKAQGQPFDLIVTDVRMPRMGAGLVTGAEAYLPHYPRDHDDRLRPH